MEKNTLKTNIEIIKNPIGNFKESRDSEPIGNEYTEKRKLVTDKLSFEDGIKRAIEKTQDSYLKILGNILLTNPAFIKDKHAFIAKDNMKDEFIKLTGASGHGFDSGFESINDPRIIIHEAIHVYTGAIFSASDRVLNEQELEFKNKINDYFNIAKETPNEGHYGLTDLHEFLSELSNRKFIGFLDSIPYKNESFSNISNETLQELIPALKNQFIKDFEIISELKTTEDGKDYFYTLKFADGVEQNRYFKSEREAISFLKKKNGEYDTNNLSLAIINEFLKLVRNITNEETHMPQ